VRSWESAIAVRLLLVIALLGVAATARAATHEPSVTPGDTLTDADDGLPVAEVRIEPYTIFDPMPNDWLRPLYKTANALHVRTREGTIRGHVLVHRGAIWRADLARETERQLRALNIFDDVNVIERRVGDSVHVTVVTHDAWTTSPEFNIQRGGNRVFGSFQFSEHNLLGRGQDVSLAYREDPSGIARSISGYDPGIAGTHLVFGASASTGTSGTSSDVNFGLPFYAEDAPRSYGFDAGRASSTARLYAADAQLAQFARRFEQVMVYAGRGHRTGRTITRLSGSLLIWDRAVGPSSLAPIAPPEFAGGEERLRVRRLAGEVRFWRPAYVERTGVDRVDAIEDFDLGRSVAFALGYSPHVLGATDDEGYAALHASIGADAGAAGFGWVRMRSSTRLADGPRESLIDVDARWVNQALPRQTLVVAALGGAAYRPARDFQYVIGGLNGLRAHGVHALAGEQMVRFNTESRWRIGRNYYQLFSLGGAAFWDVGHTWGAGSASLGWQQDVGIGLRLSSPHSAVNQVVRFDLAWRVSPSGVRPGGAVFSFGSSQAF
jgi:hypothetical protein